MHTNLDYAISDCYDNAMETCKMNKWRINNECLIMRQLNVLSVCGCISHEYLMDVDVLV